MHNKIRSFFNETKTYLIPLQLYNVLRTHLASASNMDVEHRRGKNITTLGDLKPSRIARKHTAQGHNIAAIDALPEDILASLDLSTIYAEHHCVLILLLCGFCRCLTAAALTPSLFRRIRKIEVDGDLTC